MEFNNPSTLIKDITSGKEARKKIAQGVNALANAVKSTLGASGKCVIYEDAMGNPIITKDGVTVAESVVLMDAVENMGATMIKEAASNTVKEAGDGTTTAIVLAQALLNTVNNYKGKESIRKIKAGIDKATKEILEYLENTAVTIKGDMLDNVAIISCNNEPILGGIISEAFKKAGKDGEVLMNDSEDEHTTIETTKGVQMDCGLKSPYLRTNLERETAELEDPLVLLITSPLSNLRKIQNILEYCLKKNRALLIIGELEQQPLATLISNKVKGVLKVNIIDVPGFGPTKQDTIDDVALMTGAIAVNEQLGDDMDFIDMSVLGSVAKSVTTATKTVMQCTSPEGADERAKEVRAKIKKEKNGFIKKKLEDRLNILSGSVSVIKVGAESKIELKEKKARVEDAIYAVKAAIKEGIVPGGGIALLNAAYHSRMTEETFDPSKGFTEVFSELSPGEKILRQAIQAPFYAILENADTVLTEPLMEQLRKNKGEGVDVVTGEIVDMIKRGIIDPVLVTKTALKNAVSVVSTIISADTIISNRRIE